MTTPVLTRHVLPGLRPEPLASYLAGLGLIRILGEQADPLITARWTADGLEVATAIPDIATWLADEYAPTPVVSPWNGGSGFGVDDKKQRQRLAALRSHPSKRLNTFRQALEVAEKIGVMAREQGWIKDGSAKSPDKRRAVQELRNRCPDALLPWIDAAIVLTGEEPQFPPILGTGGNDGRLEFSANFHASLLAVLGTTDKERARSLALARDLLAGTENERLVDVPVGQFDPGKAGGPSSSRYGSADSRINPWGYVLCVEGALLFASGTTRRHLHADRRAAMPFTVNTSPDGSGSGAVNEDSHGELWTPVWSRDFTLSEIRQLFSEARASWNGRPARRAVDFYAATRTLGVARGVEEFVRYGMHRRNGQAHTAIPLDRIRVREDRSVSLAAVVEHWVSRIEGSEASKAVGEALRAFQAAHLELAREGGAWPLARMLAALTTLEMAVGRSGRARSAVPVRYAPPAGDFLDVLKDEESPELRIAVGIASCATRPVEGPSRTMRQLLLPVDPGGWRDAPVVPGFGARPLASVLADVLIWRSRTATGDRDARKYRGVTTFWGIPVPAADLHAFATGDDQVDEKLLDTLLRACLALNWRNVRPDWIPRKPDVPVTTLGLLHPLATGLNSGNPRDEPDDEPVPALSPDWAARLAAGQVPQVHEQACARLLQAGWTAVPAPPDGRERDGARIAAALVPRCLRSRAVLCTIAFETKPLPAELES
jgi:CRISPR-associated protein Csx17